MITFEQARRIVEAADAGRTEPYGYQSPGRWFPVIAPERTGGRIPGVDKSSGDLTWMSSNDHEYMQSAVYGPRP